ncbi:MAG: D-glycero-beta-D-manno-heptose-1,7-bisphosphate 7-phosphatase [Chromatiales bacterium]|jgi:D-glycero-D-manno-heptose 1,7-bisphosphate phosphatase|nr:D-glycero-beta-D-manno-heptose-1,7-bisphosphate 7-phosphatase [Chromatiales bacterium]MDP6150166.1 D-glycero-beta-D-manno-heptose 1,7-bisphosphate 7-phosphatase [Gammaproteobacteria bacterium]MDP7093531.1 D-glycero-beta-D-manno-heptose 1,7-bisphosphate 7-phosphatase [Gammaproteobacteria bacterium]MDP7270987.1 D-glycero-beta-D-manno-heptose 1,7-bisphosphate 7-phosphatase [Gammaproteobacteria bacterium]HJP04720.1 D-glycero-beta-D-manno-heptose 1,7-bisphosphate 7-phosphatase [Gammaproteobacteri
MTLSQPQAVLLDRDGVINRDSPDFIKTPDEWVALPGSLEAIARLTKAGFLIGIATNQSGVGRGLFSIDTLWDIHQKMLAEIYAAGGFVTRIFFCLHTPEDNCDCRKPKPGLLYQAAELFACGFDNMTVIGDSERDLEAAIAIGARPVLVRTGNGRATEHLPAAKDIGIYDDLGAAVDALVAEREDNT